MFIFLRRLFCRHKELRPILPPPEGTVIYGPLLHYCKKCRKVLSAKNENGSLFVDGQFKPLVRDPRSNQVNA